MPLLISTAFIETSWNRYGTYRRDTAVGHGDTVLRRGLQGDTPRGRQSWQEAMNQARNNLEYMREYLEPSEIVAILADVGREGVRNLTRDTLQDRINYLEQLRDYHTQMIDVIDTEIERTRRIMNRE